MTDFQKRIVAYVKRARPGLWASAYEIAANEFAEKWAHKSGRGALIGHVDRGAQKAGLLRHSPSDRWASPWYSLPSSMRDEVN